LQDISKDNSNQSGDWSSADWLEGWCDHMLKEDSAANEAWGRAKAHSHEKLLPPSTEDNVVCIALLGFGPIKIQSGSYGEHLSYRNAHSDALQAAVKVNGQYKKMMPAENILAQATSRGLRKMDEINEEKADAKESSNTAGDILTGGGIAATMGGAMGHNKDAVLAGLGAAAAGLITKSISSGIKPNSDVRNWELLPASIHILPLHYESPTSLEYQVLDRSGRVIRPYTISAASIPSSKIILIIER
jgi:hypothetical protein